MKEVMASKGQLPAQNDHRKTPVLHGNPRVSWGTEKSSQEDSSEANMNMRRFLSSPKSPLIYNIKSSPSPSPISTTPHTVSSFDKDPLPIKQEIMNLPQGMGNSPLPGGSNKPDTPLTISPQTSSANT